MSAASTPPPASADPLADSLARWRATVDAGLKGASYEKQYLTRTAEGIVLRPLYSRADLPADAALGARPGEAPFWRGIRPLGYRAGAWEVAQEIAAGSAGAFNRAVRDALIHGQTALVLTPDRATLDGCDPDEATAAAVGGAGLSLADATDVAETLNGIDLSAVKLYLAAGADPLPLAALVLEAARRGGANPAELTGALTADPLGAWVTKGELPAPLETFYDGLAGWTRWAETAAPELHTVGVDASIWGNAGGTATQELAFALATAVEYLRELGQRGLLRSMVARRLSFSFSIGPQFFMEVAKFRAFRPLWTRVVTAFGGDPEAATAATLGAATGRWNKTLLDPHVNLLRVTTEALSAVLGGCDRLHIAPYDEVTGASTEVSRRIARNLHTLIAEEFNFCATADAAGGSWYVETLTDELARAAWALFQEIERRGGMSAALREGYPQAVVAEAAAVKREGLAKRRIGLVGTNLFPNLKETPLATVNGDAAHRRDQRAKEIAARRGRHLADIKPGLDWAARFSAALTAAREGATVGQLRRLSLGTDTSGEPIVALVPQRAGADFEALRAAAAALVQRTGARPKVFLAKIGPPLQHKARADFSAGFFAVGGFEVLAKAAFATAEEAAAAAIGARAPVVVLCSTDATYPVLVPAFASAVRAKMPDTTIILAGLPADPVTVRAFRGAGIDDFIHVRANVHDVLAGLLKKIGDRS